MSRSIPNRQRCLDVKNLVTLLKKKFLDAAKIILLEPRLVKYSRNQKESSTSVKQYCLQRDFHTHNSRKSKTRLRESQYYALINSPNLKVKKGDYLGQAILKTQARVMRESYW
jgi:hypothetical protein